MMNAPKRIGTMPGLRIAAAAFACLVLAACMLSPGKFTSSLDIRKDGAFTFAYTGEIHMLALGKLANMDRTGRTFTPQPCTNEETGAQRTCGESEVARQKSEWEEGRSRSAERRRSEAESMKSVLGGLDPSDPKAAEELAARLRRQAGWRRVDYKGDGLFDVDFAMTGRLDRDFAFPTIERMPMANAFVAIARRSDGTLRIDTPGFGPAAGGEPLRGMMGGMAASSGSKDSPWAGMPTPDGSFTITTDADVLANNTDDGPKADSRGQRLGWTINVRTAAAPMALLQLSTRP